MLRGECCGLLRRLVLLAVVLMLATVADIEATETEVELPTAVEVEL